MTLLIPFSKNTSRSTDLYWQLFTASVSHKLARLLLYILGCTRGLIHCLANLLPLTIALLLYRLVALPHCLIVGLLLEGYGALLLKVLLTHLLLAGFELSNIRIVALF